MRAGLRTLADFYSRRNDLFGVSQEEIDEAWEAWDEEEKGLNKERDAWEATVPGSKERAEFFFSSGAMTQEQAEEIKRKYLQDRYEEKLKEYLENGGEYPKELKKIVSEYQHRFEDKIGLTEQEVDTARNIPLEKFIEVRRDFAKCPFHNEKSGSLHVTRNLYHCFGCGEQGDTIRFIEKTKELRFQDAVRFILSTT